jgi:hypothetical protein
VDFLGRSAPTKNTEVSKTYQNTSKTCRNTSKHIKNTSKHMKNTSKGAYSRKFSKSCGVPRKRCTDETFPNISNIKTYQNISKYIKTYQNISKYIKYIKTIKTYSKKFCKSCGFPRKKCTNSPGSALTRAELVASIWISLLFTERCCERKNGCGSRERRERREKKRREGRMIMCVNVFRFELVASVWISLLFTERCCGRGERDHKMIV